MNRRTALWISGAAMVALFAVLGVIDQRMSDTGGPGIIGFELAGSEHRAHEILADWGDEGHDAAKLSLWLDYPFIVAYAAFWTLAVAATRDLAARRRWRRLAPLGDTVVAFPICAGILDALENVGLLLALGRHGGALAPLAATIFAAGKFLLFYSAVAYVVAGLVLRLRRRGGGKIDA
jgi:hypothetical protein